jgi:hypothetical protein
MNRVKILALLATVALLALLPVGLFAGQPEAPHQFYGTATLADGSLAPDGTVVSAWVGDDEAATAVVESSFQAGFYLLKVAPAIGSSYVGQSVTFLVDGVSTGDSVAWVTRSSQELNLSAVTPVPPTPTPAPTPAPTPVPPLDMEALTSDVKTALLDDLLFRVRIGGRNGNNGLDGAAGSDGSDGANGANGARGAAGANGANGTNAVDGANGTNGVDGADGRNGTAGAAGAAGEDGGGGLGIVALILAIVALLGVGGAFAMSRKS